jgi:sulfur transfer protein SufE
MKRILSMEIGQKRRKSREESKTVRHKVRGCENGLI